MGRNVPRAVKYYESKLLCVCAPFIIYLDPAVENVPAYLPKQYQLICMEGEMEGVDSVWLTIRGYSLMWGEEGIMQDRRVCLEREIGRAGSLPHGYG